jgi:phosphoserine phosphatase
LVADIDSPLIGHESVDELAALAGVGDRVAAITARAMRGEVAFAPALRERVALLAGLPETVIGEVLKERITLNRGARTLVQTMRANGAYVAIVSGGFRQFTGAIRERLGADEDRANVLVIEGGKLTGKVIEPILGQDAKLDALKAIPAAMGVTLDDTWRSATAPTIFRCCKPPALASPIAQAQGRRWSGRACRAHRSLRAPLCAGFCAEGFRGGVTGVRT